MIKKFLHWTGQGYYCLKGMHAYKIGGSCQTEACQLARLLELNEKTVALLIHKPNSSQLMEVIDETKLQTE